MAELYVQQGHRERAIEVYRQLLKMRPNDAALAARLRELDGTAPSPAQASRGDRRAAEESVAEAGPTIRDFLVGIAEFRLRAAASPNDHGAQASQARAAAPSIPTVPREQPNESTVAGSLHNLFSGAERSTGRADAPAPDDFAGLTPKPSADSRQPASTEPSAIPGRPATPAATELSLDHVFRHATPAAGSGTQSTFSFDQFFSQQAQQDVAAADTQPGSERASGENDDIQQFNAWLEGLKKT
jgi:hypothetical protein